MIASPPPSGFLRPLASFPSSLLSRFQGAIAGSILGYLIGDYYAGPGMTQPYASAQTLDLRWLSDPTVPQRTSPPLFYPSVSGDAIPAPQGRGDAGIDLSMAPLLKAMISMMDCCLTHGYADSKADIQAIRPTPQSSTQAALILLPLLLLHHDHPMNQRRAIAQVLTLWSAPTSWENHVVIFATTLSIALQPTMGIRLDPPLAQPNQSGVEFTCHCFFRQPHSYEMGLLALVNSKTPSQIEENRLAMAALLGALIGGRSGFYGLPLGWQYAMLNPVTGTTAVSPEAMGACPNSHPVFGEGQVVHVLPLTGLMQNIRQLLDQWNGIAQMVPGGGNSILSAKLPPTVTAPRTLVLDL